jgi:hypothetical protein
MILVLLLSPAVKTLMYEHGREKNIRQAGLWLADHSPSAAMLLTNDSRIALYANMEFAPIDIHSSDVSKMILKHQASHIVVRGTEHELSQFSMPSVLREVQRFLGKNKTVVILENKGF